MRRDVTPAEVEEAARKARLTEVIASLPGQYQFRLAEGGANLSGGQRQRIALARIFLRQPRILILDEATSALDNTSELYIQQEIEAMSRAHGATVISIAHRSAPCATATRSWSWTGAKSSSGAPMKASPTRPACSRT